MKHKLAPIVLLILLPLLMFMAASCGGQKQSTDYARETITKFLEMCKQGHAQAAIDKYVQPYQAGSWSYIPVFDDISDYGIQSISLNELSWSIATISITTGTGYKTSWFWTVAPTGSP